MAVVRSFMSKLLMPRMPVLKTLQWRITSVRCASGPGLGTGSGPQINFLPEGDTVTDEDQEQNGVNTSNNISINEDEIVEEPIPAQVVINYENTDEAMTNSDESPISNEPMNKLGSTRWVY